MNNKYKHIGETKKKFVEKMFDDISSKYDFFNRLTTFYIDQYWRSKFINKLNLQENNNVLDIATGTGDVIIQICKKNQTIIGTGYDCSQNMLDIASSKSKKKKLDKIDYIHGYAENLPFKDNSMDIVTISFGIRNFNNYEKAISEIYRVLKPNGKLAILEFCKPKINFFHYIFSFYFKKVLPIIGRIMTGQKIFDYLPESVNNFFSKDELTKQLEKLNFKKDLVSDLTFGVCSIIIVKKIKITS